MTAEEFGQFEHVIVQNVKKEAALQAIYIKHPKSTLMALYAWKTESVKAVAEYLENRISENPCEAVDFLKVICPKSTSDGTNFKLGDFDNDTYTKLSNLMDVNVLISAIEKYLGQIEFPK